MDFEQLDKDALEESLEWDQSEDNSEYKAAKLKQLFPINYIEMRDKFFQEKCKTNPHFIYKTIVYPDIFKVHREHQDLALKILHNAPPYPKDIPYLNEAQVREIIEKYLDDLGLKDYVQIQLTFECLSRTSIAFLADRARLKIRTPLSYTKINLEGVLHHEIGTHILRTLNHRQNCERKPSEKGKIIQEGLAAINQVLPEAQPVLFKSALRYVAAIYASEMDFVSLYHKLSKFVKDPEECWRQAVRVKRGISNTEEKGGYYKDQNYLIGAVEILSQRNEIDFEKLYYGKLTPKQTLNLSDGVLPPFLGTPEKLRAYKKKLDKIAIANFID